MEEFRAFKKREEMKRPSTNTRLTRMVIRLEKLHFHVACRPALQQWQVGFGDSSAALLPNTACTDRLLIHLPSYPNQVWSQRIELYRREQAAKIIKARILQKYARDTAKMVRHMAKLQEDRSRVRREERVAKNHKAAVMIQVHWRVSRDRKVLKELKQRQAAAKMIQNNWRVIYDYRKIKLFRLVSTKRDKAAIKVRRNLS